MRYQIKRVSLAQTAKVMSIFWFIISIPMVILTMVPIMFASDPNPPMLSGFAIVTPFFYAIFGYVFTMIAGWIYNWLANKMGGIEFELHDVSNI